MRSFVRLSILLAAAAALLVPVRAQETQLAEGWDFVPGERLLLYDDFTDMAKGGAPPHWKVRGSTVKLGTNGKLIATQDVQLYPNIASWPKNFTVEQEVTFEKAAEPQERDYSWKFGDEDGNWLWTFWFRFQDADNVCEVHLDGEEGTLGGAECKFEPGKPNTINAWLQDGRIRIYLNGARLIDVNQVKIGAWKVAWLSIEPHEGPVTLGRFRIAESAPDISQTILASGRYVSHGIQFDVNSDRLRPESTPVLKMIAEALQKQPSLKLRIEGHTDSSGDAAKNVELSKRRAEAVRNALVSQFSVGADRLTSEGFGANKPLSSNDTPQGRANNRRVEFAKL